ncbi:MAG: GntR family transcriptional regulator [Oscillospiraceae bacterium]|nr:GntR family transcriptional regulator [Oscillospiraceae bacterium]MBQ4487118.1 GntR family transcriptional regulator [Oscillospiraceae bacterium]
MLLETDDRSLRIRVFNAIENAILDGEYKDGDSLNELRLSKELGVSRTPVREALMQLELEGLVRNIPNKGAVVVGVTEQDTHDIYEIRIRIEGLASRLCAENITDDELHALEQIVDLQEFYLLKNDTEQIWKLDGDFHKIIYDASRSRPLRFTLSNFHNYIKKARDISMQTEGRAEKTVAEHRAILDAIKAHNGELAEKLTAQHISNAENNIFRNEESAE